MRSLTPVQPVKLIAKRVIPYKGRDIQAEEPFEASPRDAALFQAAKFAVLDDGTRSTGAAPAPTKRKRGYRRRDMQAERGEKTE